MAILQALHREHQQPRGSASPVPAPPRFSDATLAVALILVTLLCYANILTNGFVYDDQQQILQNPYVGSWRFLPEIFRTTVWSFVGEAGTTNYYRPLMTLSYLILWKIFGPLPIGFHLFSIVLHSAVVVLVFLLGRRLFADYRVGWFAALIFAIHPVHTEAVAWIASITDLELAFFFLLAMCIFSREKKPGWKERLGLIVAFCLALLSKEPALMLLPGGIFFEYALRGERGTPSWLRKLSRYSPLVLVGGSYLALRIALFGKLAPVLQHPQIRWAQALYSGFASIYDYFELLIWPVHLSAFHVFHVSNSPWEFKVVAGYCIVATALFAIVKTFRRAPAVSFSIVWMGLTLAPVLNARWMASNVLTERYLYLPSIGFCWLLAVIAIRFWDSSRRLPWGAPTVPAVLCVLFLAVACFSVVSTAKRNRVWASDMVLYTATLKSDPDAHIIRSNLAGVYFEMQDLNRAEEEWKRALAGKPDNLVTMNALGVLYTKEKRYSEAEAMFRRAIAIKPLWGEARYNHGILLHATHDEKAAMEEFQTAIKVSPLNPQARLWYGKALLDDGHMREAEVQLKQSLALQTSTEALKALSEVYIRTRQDQSAETAIRHLINDRPFDADAHLRLALLLETLGRRDDARKEFEAVLITDPRSAEAKSGLARLANPQ